MELNAGILFSMKAGLPLTILMLVLISLPCRGELRIGDTREDVIEALGSPEAQIRKRSRETLYYGRSTVELAHGVVVRFDHDVERAADLAAPPRPTQLAQARSSAPAAVSAPKTEPRPSVGAPESDSASIRKISNGGKRVDMQDLLVPGKITVVDFYADWCGPCRRVSPHLETMAKGDSDIVLRKVDIVKWGTEVTQQYGIRSVPNIRVFDRRGQMVGQGTPSLQLVQQYVRQAK